MWSIPDGRLYLARQKQLLESPDMGLAKGLS